MRVFIALDLPDSVRQMIEAIQERLVALKVGGRIVPSQTLHITLRFFENVSDEGVDAIAQVVEQVGAKLSTPMLLIDGVGGFVRQAGDTIYARIGGGVEGLYQIYQSIGHALIDKGFSPEVRPFYPHITLMRGANYRMANHLSVKSELFFGTSLTLYRSILTTTPPTYDPLLSVMLPR